VSGFDETGFSWEPQASFLLLRIIGFASIRTVGFDPSMVIVRDVAIIMIHAGFFSKAVVWLKTHTGSDG
jgi:hypothetical protein